MVAIFSACVCDCDACDASYHIDVFPRAYAVYVRKRHQRHTGSFLRFWSFAVVVRAGACFVKASLRHTRHFRRRAETVDLQFDGNRYQLMTAEPVR